MGIDDSEVSRVLRGDVPVDDPVWGEVASFLDDVNAVYPTVSTTSLEGPHLEAVARESRLVQNELRPRRQGAVKRMFQGTHRILAGSVGAALIALTAGVGVASALGINPLEQLFAPHPAASSGVPRPMSTDGASPETAGGTTKGEPGTTTPRVVPSSLPTPTALPTPSATKTPGSVGDEHKNPRATEKTNHAATPTPKRATPTPHRATPTPPKHTPTPPGRNK